MEDDLPEDEDEQKCSAEEKDGLTLSVGGMGRRPIPV